MAEVAAVDPILAHPGRVRDLLAFLGRVESGDRDDCLVLADWLDDCGDAARAEYVRVSVEAEKRRRHIDDYHDSKEIWALDDRRAALLAANPQWTSLPCPACEGHGTLMSGHTVVFCETCRRTGDLFKPPERFVWEANPESPYYGDQIVEGGKPRIDPALDFFGRGCVVPFPRTVGCRLAEVLRNVNDVLSSTRDEDWQPTPWARAAVAACPTLRGFRCTDRVLPYTVVNGSWWRDGGRDWAVEAGVLPAPVFEATWELHPANRHRDVAGRSLLFPTESAASDALATALHRIVAATSRAPSGPTPPAAA
jgi:uncharacterized protein (TIGR02996 family)